VRRIFAFIVIAVPLQADAQTPALLKQYCVGCHNQKLKNGGVALDSLDHSNVGRSASTWEKVLRKVRTGEMPPPGLPRPNPVTASSFTSWLEKTLDDAAAANPNPGRPAVHRLNRAEYSNAIRDLLAFDIKPGSMLPVDDSGYGFDNIADVLSLSPALLERYLSVARLVSALAVGDPKMKPTEDQFLPLRDPPSDFRRPSRSERVSSDLPFNSRGGLSFQYYFPVDAEYVFRIRVTGQDPPKLELRVPVHAGLRTVGVTFLRESPKAEVEVPGGRGAAANQYAGPPPPLPIPAEMDLRLDGAKLKRFEVPQRPGQRPDVSAVILGGPYNVTGRGETPSRAKIFTCRPATARDEEPCARAILSNLTRRAFRRPIGDSDLKPLLAFYRRGPRRWRL
jgi:hypothetical protein